MGNTSVTLKVLAEDYRTPSGMIDQKNEEYCPCSTRLWNYKHYQISYIIVLLKTPKFYAKDFLFLYFCHLITDKNRKWKMLKLVQFIFKAILKVCLYWIPAVCKVKVITNALLKMCMLTLNNRKFQNVAVLRWKAVTCRLLMHDFSLVLIQLPTRSVNSHLLVRNDLKQYLTL